MAKGKMPMMGGMPNMNGMMKQIQKMQKDMEETQQKLSESTVEATAGGGMVTVVANGKKEIIKLTIKPEAVDPEDVEMLQDLVMVAVNEAIRKATENAESEMGKVTGGLGNMNIPGLF
jgi:DNA-binding YbaB/EbfC family protein